MSSAIARRHPYQGFGHYANSGVGIESMELAKLLRKEFVGAVRRSMLLRPKVELLRELETVYKKCLNADWDGEGAEPIPKEAYREAARFIQLLPLLMPQLPEIVAVPNGQVGLEWYQSKNNVLVVAFAGNQTLTYAGLYGKSEAVPGKTLFTDTIPEEILDSLTELFKK
jgi:hypothetical protein